MHVNADGAFGLYMKADGITASVSSNAGIIAANNKDSVGIILMIKQNLQIQEQYHQTQEEQHHKAVLM